MRTRESYRAATPAFLLLGVVPLSCAAPAATLEARPAVVASADVPRAAVADPSDPRAPVADPHAAGADAEVIALCEAYRRAVVARDVDAIMALASPAYHDDGGTADPSDDLDYAELRAYLLTGWGKVDAIEYELKPGTPKWQGTRVRVPIHYTARYRLDGQWVNKADATELTLERRGGKLLIVSGM